MNMIRVELKSALHVAIRNATTQLKKISLNRLQLTDDDKHHYVNIKITPVKNIEPIEGVLLLIIIEETPVLELSNLNVDRTMHETILQFEDELSYEKNMLGAKMEELEASNEELKAENEELHSLNESLTTTNLELQNYIEHLFSAKVDINNLLDHIDIATIFLDKNLCIKHFTPKATEIINLIPADVGRPMTHLVSNVDYQHLTEDALTVLNTQEPLEMDCLDKSGNCYLIKISPYRSTNNMVAGVVIAFLNIPSQKQVRNKL